MGEKSQEDPTQRIGPTGNDSEAVRTVEIPPNQEDTKEINIDRGDDRTKIIPPIIPAESTRKFNPEAIPARTLEEVPVYQEYEDRHRFARTAVKVVLGSSFITTMAAFGAAQCGLIDLDGSRQREAVEEAPYEEAATVDNFGEAPPAATPEATEVPAEVVEPDSPAPEEAPALPIAEDAFYPEVYLDPSDITPLYADEFEAFDELAGQYLGNLQTLANTPIYEHDDFYRQAAMELVFSPDHSKEREWITAVNRRLAAQPEDEYQFAIVKLHDGIKGYAADGKPITTIDVEFEIAHLQEDEEYYETSLLQKLEFITVPDPQGSGRLIYVLNAVREHLVLTEDYHD